MTSLVHCFEAGLSSGPDRIAVTLDEGDIQHHATYKQIQDTANKVCSELQQCGIRKETVAISVQSKLYAPAFIIGVMRAPAAFLWLDPHTPDARLHFLITKLHLRAFLVDKENKEEVVKKLVAFDPWIKSSRCEGDFEVVILKGVSYEVWPVPLAYVITTSGTTGTPKIVKVPHACIMHNITHLRILYSVSPKDVVFQASPMTFDPSIVEIFTTFYSGAKLVVVPEQTKRMPDRLKDVLLRQRISVLQATPALVLSLGHDALYNHLMCADSSLRVLALGGEMCPNPTSINSWRPHDSNVQIINLYGITEVSSWASYHCITEDDLRSSEDISLGKALSGTRLEVRDESGQVITQGQGYLYIGCDEDGPHHGDRVCLLDDEMTLTSGQMRCSGDWVDIRYKGHLYYMGRKDDQIKRHGKRMSLRELERVANQCKNVEQTCAVHIPGGTVCLVVQCCHLQDNPGTTDRNVISDVKKKIIETLPDYYLPNLILELSKMPITPHGKIDKRAVLKECERRMSVQPASSATCWTGLAKLISQTWKECLQIGDDVAVDKTDRFLEHGGGTSLQALQLVQTLEQRTGLQSPATLDIVLNKTFGDMLDAMHILYTKKCVFYKERHVEHENQNTLYKEENKISMSLPDINSRDWNEKIISNTSKRKLSEKNISNTAEKNKQAKQNSLEEMCVSAVRDFECDIQKVPFLDTHIPPGTVLSTKRTSNAILHKNNKANLMDIFKDHSRDGSNCVLVNKNEENISEEEQKASCDSRMQVLWKYDTGKCVDASPLLVTDSQQGVVYIGSHSHKFCAISLDSGATLWETELGDRVESSACLSASGFYVIIGCYDGQVYVLDSSSGEIMWTVVTRGQIKCSPCLDPDTGAIYIGSHDHHLYALDIENQILLWRCHMDDGSVFSSPCTTLQCPLVFTATLTGAVHAVSKKDGDIKWTYRCDKPVFSSPAISPCGALYVGSVDGKLHAIDLHGQLLWSYSVYGPIFSSPCVWTDDVPCDQHPSTNHHVVFGSHDGHVYSISSRGKLDWKFAADSQLYSSPFAFKLQKPLKIRTENYFKTEHLSENRTEVARQYCDKSSNCETQCMDVCMSQHTENRILIAVCSTKGSFYLVNASSGRLVDTLTLPGEVFSSPVYSHSKLVVGCRDNYVYCINI